MILAATGHRPQKTGGYSKPAFNRLARFAEQQLILHKPSKVYDGFALGWDLAVARACANLGIQFVACIPCDKQESRWPAESQKLYRELLALASESIIVCPGPYEAWKMQARNQFMVDRCERVLGLWNGSDGGTANCIRYAERLGRPVINCWDDWRNFEA